MPLRSARSPLSTFAGSSPVDTVRVALGAQRTAFLRVLAQLDIALLADEPKGKVSQDSVRKARELIHLERERLKSEGEL